MKNTLIVILVVVVGFLGYMLATDDDTDTSANTETSANTQVSDTQTSGETIDLSDQGLSQVSQNILDNSSVTTFDVSGNNLTGALPAEIRKLTNLEALIASDNNLTGIPAEIGQLSKLRIADFSNNDISGLPNEIGNLSNLETLDLRGNPNISDFDISNIQPEIPSARILTD